MHTDIDDGTYVTHDWVRMMKISPLIGAFHEEKCTFVENGLALA